ncbi:HlyC/CorC family transporter [Rhodobacter sp. KR11]|uniref:HlyC/CorC family transporter n=1 Tax=Rhodobacter sp. KR11 TaxID=2974588 RepID=UPI002222745E|nr:HlyC/CorC family transporter [Rhodobacter sp. KR11]MCW1917761.1 HlyC/CorC family transporter [Rhodobacter sp. KR11]
MDWIAANLELVLTALAVTALLVISAFFSASETALTAASRAGLKGQADKGSRGAIAALGVSEDNERMIGALLLGNNVANTLNAALTTALLTGIFGTQGVAIATVIVTVLVLVFAEVLPKTVAILNPVAVSIRVAPAIRVLIVLFSPVVSTVRALVRAILRPFGLNPDPGSHILALRDEIAGAISLGHSEGAVEKEDRDRLLGALDLSHRTVDEIMRHRRNCEMVDADLPPDDLVGRVLASSHTRLPLYRNSDENILGVIHAKDLLREVDRLIHLHPTREEALAALDVVKVAMKPYFIPDTTTLDEQMREFLKRRTHFALVVDEYGGLQGLITLEDILEEIVGEITDEFDKVDNAAKLKRDEDGAVTVEGAMTIRDVNRATDWNLPDEEANTIAGLVIHEAQMIPVQGQAFSFHGFRFEVVTRRENRLTRIRIRKL